MTAVHLVPPLPMAEGQSPLWSPSPHTLLCLSPITTPKTTNDLQVALPVRRIQLVAIVTVKFNLPKVPPSCYILHIEGILSKHNYVPKRDDLTSSHFSTSQGKTIKYDGLQLQWDSRQMSSFWGRRLTSRDCLTAPKVFSARNTLLWCGFYQQPWQGGHGGSRG